MITNQSYFPTRTNTPSRVSKREHSYNLVKQHETCQQFGIMHMSKPNSNIFRDINALKSRNYIQKTTMRPVGGMELFKKMEQGTRDRANDHRKLSKRSNNCTQRNINPLGSSQGLNRFKKEKGELEEKNTVQNSPMKAIDQNVVEEKHDATFKEETYKRQINYTPSETNLKSWNRKSVMQFNSGKSEEIRPSSCMQPRSRKQNLTSPIDKWAADQRKSYQDKMALINQINFNKPLVERYGDRYFQYLLRNRFEEDLGPSPFVYQVNGQFSRTKTIDNIKKYGPPLKDKEPLIVKGRKLKNIQN